MKKINNELAELSYSKIISFQHDIIGRKIHLHGISETKNEEFHLVYSDVSSVLTISKMPPQDFIDDLAEELGAFGEEKAIEKTKSLNLSAIINFSSRFYIATILYTLYFDAKIITLNGQVIFQTN